MPSSAKPIVWDIFCNVIDNYGDIGVCWRLARQLVAEYHFSVRLWVDELTAFNRICPEIDSSLPNQFVQGVEVHHWDANFPEIAPGGVVIEAFACHLPEQFVRAMAARKPPPAWINLDYLSAENWVSGCHTLPSPHPRLSLNKYFYFPGFKENTGGLLRESDLQTRRQAYHASPEQHVAFWRSLGQLPPAGDTLVVSLFAYENPAIEDLFNIWAQGNLPVCCLAPVTRTRQAIEAFVGHVVQEGDVLFRGSLEIRMLSFVAQADYDRLLWSCDVNFVRGEDSFVRAQWAAKPMLWHIYPQDDDAHRVKLDAFLDLYCAGLTEARARAVRRLITVWNGGRITSALWDEWMRALPDLRNHALSWEKNLLLQEDLCSNLVRFCRSKL